jgi:branched-chain amino acid transport system substrate-binding protein
MPQDYVAGWEFCDGFKQGFEERGGQVIQTQNIPFGTMDYSPYLTALKKADCVAYFLPANAIGFHKQYYDYNIGIPLLEPDHDCLMFEEMQEIGDNLLGFTGSGGWSSLIDTPANKAFVDGFRQKRGHVPVLHNEFVYNPMLFFLEAVRYTKGDTSHEAIIDALHKVTVNAPRGQLKYSANRLGEGKVYILQVVETDWGLDWQPIAEYPLKIIF